MFARKINFKSQVIRSQTVSHTNVCMHLVCLLNWSWRLNRISVFRRKRGDSKDLIISHNKRKIFKWKNMKFSFPIKSQWLPKDYCLSVFLSHLCWSWKRKVCLWYEYSFLFFSSVSLCMSSDRWKIQRQRSFIIEVPKIASVCIRWDTISSFRRWFSRGYYHSE
jgi:hypothetical protein